jgi:hypothetical protein
MTWLASYPLLSALTTQVTVYWELFFCVLIWPRLTRPIMLALAVPVHLGIAVCMGMITFGLIMLVGCLSFVPSWLVRQWFERKVAVPPQDAQRPERTMRRRGSMAAGRRSA